jgi:NAD+ kinase
MKVGIYFNKNYLTDNMPYIERIKGGLAKYNHSCTIVENFDDLNGMDILFVLGGDGTILMVASECAKRGAKIIGINYGHVGFLAEFEPEKLEEAIDLVCKNQYQTVKRSLLQVEVGSNTYFALNDLVLQRSTSGVSFANTVSIHAEIDGSTVDNFSSDGVIVSTPTGSTAYSLSAGGSILSPDIHAFILTPICAHSLHSCPIVFNDSSQCKLYSLSSHFEINVVIDGKIVDTVSAMQEVTVKKAKFFVEFITNSQNNFYQKLLLKLNIWSR